MADLELKPIKDFQNLHFWVKNYQRGYKWTKEEVTQLLNDIYEFEPQKENEFYFLKESVYINIATPLSMILVGYILKYTKINVIFCVSGLLIILLGLLCAIKFLKNNDIKL